jgi:hypothetical protein
VPATSWWYTVQELASLGGDARVAAAPCPAPNTEITEITEITETEARASHPVARGKLRGQPVMAER